MNVKEPNTKVIYQSCYSPIKEVIRDENGNILINTHSFNIYSASKNKYAEYDFIKKTTGLVYLDEYYAKVFRKNSF